MIDRLFEAGADVFRINMSHTPQDRMRTLVASIREVERKRDRPIGILADLQGPKLRIGEFAEPYVQLRNGATFVLDSESSPGTVERVYLPHPEILAALKPGHKLLLDDGKIRLEALETSPKHAITRVVVGGKLSARASTYPTRRFRYRRSLPRTAPISMPCLKRAPIGSGSPLSSGRRTWPKPRRLHVGARP